MNFFRKMINSVVKRQVIADMYDEPAQIPQPQVVAPPMAAPETNVPQDVQPAQPKPTYTRDKSRRERMQRMRDMNQNRGMEKEEGYLGYTAKEFTTVLPMMMDNLKMFFTPGMSIAEVYDLHEISPDFQSLFPEEFLDDYWAPLLNEALIRLDKQSSQQQQEPQDIPSVVSPGDASQLQQPQQLKIYDENEMKAWIETNMNSSREVPAEIREVPENWAMFQEVSKAIEMQRADAVRSEEQKRVEEEMASLRGNSPTEIADAAINQLIMSNPEYMKQLASDPRFGKNTDDWTLDLADYVFKGVPDGVSNTGAKDFRIRFFLEPKGGQGGGKVKEVSVEQSNLDLAPAHVREWMEANYPTYNLDSSDVYRALYDNFIEDLSYQLLEIIDPNQAVYDEYGEIDEEGKARQHDRIWNFIARKLQSKTKERRMKERGEAEQAGAGEEGAPSLEQTIEQQQPMADAAKMSEEDRVKYMESIFGNLASMGDMVKDLSREVRDHIFDKYGMDEVVTAPNGKQSTNSAFYAAIAADAAGDLASKALHGWHEQVGNQNLSPAEVKKLTEGKPLTRRPKRRPADMTDEEYIERARLGNLVFDPNAENDWSSINWYKLVPNSLMYEQMQAARSGSLEADPNDPNSYRNLIPNLNSWRGRDFEGMTGELKDQSLFGYAAQSIAETVEEFVMDEAFKKYPKNVILAFLDANKAYSGLQSAARYTVFNEQGDKDRRELLTHMLSDEAYEMPEDSMKRLNQYLEQKGLQGAASPEIVDTLPVDVVNHIVQPEVSRLKKQDFDRRVGMGLWDSVANILSLPGEYDDQSPIGNKEQREEWNKKRREYLGTKAPRRRRASLAYEIIKIALTRIEDLQRLKTSMSKFADTSMVDVDIARTRLQAKIALRILKEEL